MPSLSFLRAGLVSMLLSLAALPGMAHEVRPIVGDIEVGETEVTITLRVALEPLVAGINLDLTEDTNNAPEAAIHDRLRELEPDQLEAAFRADWNRISRMFLIEVEGQSLSPRIVSVTIPAVGDVELSRDSLLTVAADLPDGTAPVQVGLAPGFGSFVPREMGRGTEAYEGFLSGGELTPPLPRTARLQDGASGFLPAMRAGFESILPQGPDHVLLVLGLVFFGTGTVALLLQVAAFTGAHVVTLILGATGVFSIPANLLVPLIAATIVYVGIDNTLGSSHIRNRAYLAGAFGLLHGLGFAEAFTNRGFASDSFATDLLGFLLGIELGLLAVIGAAFVLLGWCMGKPWYRKVIATPASLLIAAIGAFWVVEGALA